MCGIVGGIWRSRSPDVERLIVSALQELRHRGPDDQGYEVHRTAHGVVSLGQNRLSIIDLSSGGHQPMRSQDGRFLIAFNGEIYNYKELREELRALGHTFLTQSDTEVLLAAWIQWGKTCLPRLDGMFAFSVLDHARSVLVCVRDAFGIKPLFYSSNDQEFTFASEQRALSALRGNRGEPNVQRAYDYLVHGDYDSGDETFTTGVKHLLPGSLIEIDLASWNVSQPQIWWTAPVGQTSELTFDQAVEAVREQFLDNIRLHLRSDVPLGAALSGGVDSSAVVCAMRHVEPKAELHTFSYIADSAELSEERWIDLVNEATGATPHKIRASSQDLARDLDRLVEVQGEPFGSTSIYAQYRVFEHARANGITVTLDGQGADELLAGYDGYPGQRILSLLEGGRFRDAHAFAKASSNWPGRSYRRSVAETGRIRAPDAIYAQARKLSGRNFRPDWLDIDMLKDLGVNFREERAPLRPENSQRRVVEQLAHNLQRRGLPHLLRHGDRNAMAFSIESRVPFLTIPAAKLLLGLPENYLVSAEGETKHVFRNAMRGIVPDAILDRRDKLGFATPEEQWFRALEPTCRLWLEDAGSVPFLNKSRLLASFDDMMRGRRNFTWQAWRWVNYVRWYSNRYVSDTHAINE